MRRSRVLWTEFMGCTQSPCKMFWVGAADSHATLHHVACLHDLSTACMRAHLNTLIPHLHHDIAHTFVHAYLFIYLRIPFHTRLLAATRTHTDSHVSVPPLTLLYYYLGPTHSCACSTSVLSCLDERTACIYIISSDVCAFSQGAGVNLEPHATRSDKNDMRLYISHLV